MALNMMEGLRLPFALALDAGPKGADRFGPGRSEDTASRNLIFM
jgi:hypothetical protein